MKSSPKKENQERVKASPSCHERSDEQKFVSYSAVGSSIRGERSDGEERSDEL